jgi:hypothetical protein
MPVRRGLGFARRGRWTAGEREPVRHGRQRRHRRLR